MSRLVGQSYQYLQRSKLPTDKFQRSLPRLKIPKLDKTCERYLAALEPVFKDDPNLAKTREITKKFQSGEAKELHSALVQYDKSVKHTSYINEFWFNMYLSSRVPLPLNFNPFLAWKDAAEGSELSDQIVRSTNFIVSAIRFKRSLEENLLEPEIFHLNPKKTCDSSFYRNFLSMTPEAIATYVSFAFKAFPLDMSQYKNLFNSTRIPRKSKDEILKSDPKSNRHLLVIKDGQFYTFEVIDHNGDLISPESIYKNLEHIANQPKPSNLTEYLSITELTTADRDFWADEREHLMGISESNKLNLSMIDSAIFALCLDDVTYKPDQHVEGAHNFLHGNNPSAPTNRWFDKSFSLIMTKDGRAAINFEHSWGDGVAILRFFNDTYYDQTKSPFLTGKSAKTEQITVRRLDFELDSRLKNSISQSKRKFAQSTSELELGVIQYEGLNRDYFKRNKLSPDAMSQLGFQLAFKKLYNSTPVTYESCSTAAFKGGRTETVRPCTNETNIASDAIMRNNSGGSSHSNNQLKELLQKCSQKHYQLCKEASIGDGFDRHLFGLKEIALKTNRELPDFYQDPLYVKGTHYVLSTSTLYGECFAGGGFAPVVPDGFGLGYGYVDKTFGVLVSSYKNRRNNTQFVQALTESFDDIRKIVEQ